MTTMMEAREPEIKLFGKNISLQENGRLIPPVMVVAASGDSSGDGGDSGSSAGNSPGSDRVCGTEEKVASRVDDEASEEGDVVDKDDLETDMDCSAGDRCEDDPGKKDRNSSPEKFQNQSESTESDENSKSSQVNEDSETGEQSKYDKSDTTNSQQKTLKKPDKILPCPRCNSMDTKFCYYNNYNVNQPRHFCKSCQRYWTAGGTMRNVPVGAGRRKNKSSSSHCRHITISDTLQAARIDVPNGYHHPNIKPNGTVLSFGLPGSPFCESMSSVLNLAEKKAPNGYRNGHYKLEQGILTPRKVGENGDDCSSGSTVTTSSSMVDGGKVCPKEPVMQNVNGFPSIQCLPSVPWPYQWNPAIPMPAICPAGYPMSFYPPPPYWNCSVPGPWSYPWTPSVSPTANQKPSGSEPNSPILGKRSSNGELHKAGTPEGKQSPEKKGCEGSVLVPKTLRIDDPDEAAKSSIWTTLGIKYDSINKGGIFNAFQSKGDKHVTKPSSLLQANPAALTRSQSFQEKA